MYIPDSPQSDTPKKYKAHQKYKGMTGYALHRKRLAYTGGKAIRTIKYPLAPAGDDAESAQVFQEFCDGVRSDYTALYGALNVSALQEGRGAYCLFNVYVDFLRAGAIFQPSEAKMKAYLNAGKEDEEMQEAMRKVDSRFVDLIDFDAFKEKVLVNTGVRTKESDEEIRVIYYGNQDAINKYKENEDKLKGRTGIFKYQGYIENLSVIKEYVEKILNGVGTKNGETESQKEQRKFWKQKFGVELAKAEDDIGPLYFLPELPLAPDCEPNKLIERIHDLHLVASLPEKDRDNEVKTLLALDHNYNALSNTFNSFFSLLYNDIQKAEQVILNINAQRWSGREDELHDRLTWLAQRVRQLPEKPSLIRSWAEYRKNFGGKLSSWLENSHNQEEKIQRVLFGYKEQGKDGKTKDIKGHRDHLRALKQTLEEADKRGETPASPDALKSIVDELVKINGELEKHNVSDNHLPAEQIKIYADLLPQVRSLLNIYIQAKYPHIEQNDMEKKKKEYKSLFATFPRLVSFPGDAKRETMKNMLQSRKVVEAAYISIIALQDMCAQCPLRDIDDFKDASGNFDRVVLLRRFDGLRRLYNASTPFAQHIIDKAVHTATGWRISALGERQVFSAYKRKGNYIEIELDITIEDLYIRLPRLVEDIKPDFSKRDINNIREYMDALELEKVRMGIITYFLDFSNIDLHEHTIHKIFSVEYFSDLHAYVQTIKAEDGPLNAEQFNTLIQRYFFAPLKGALQVMSTQKFIERYVIQPMASNDTFPIIIDKNKENWYIASHGIDKNKQSEQTDDTGDILTLDEKDIFAEDSFKSIKKPEQLFQIKSSKYQMQFLRESCPFFSKTFLKDTQVKIKEYSFIVEDICTIDFSANQPQIKREKSALYVAIPFNLTAQKQQDTNTLKAKLNNRKRYIGIDVGEYGLAYALIDTNKNMVIRSWFNYEPGIAIVRSQYRINQMRQRTGLFTQANTALAALRKSVSNNLKARIHDIAVRYNAVPSYEHIRLAILKLRVGA